MRLKYNNTVEPVLSGHPSVWLQLNAQSVQINKKNS